MTAKVQGLAIPHKPGQVVAVVRVTSARASVRLVSGRRKAESSTKDEIMQLADAYSSAGFRLSSEMDDVLI